MPITFVRSAVIKPAKFGEARALAEEQAAYFKSKTGLPVSLATQIGGPTGSVAMRVTYKDLAHAEQVVNEMDKDPEMQRFTEAAEGLFVEGTAQDSLWRED